MTLSSSGATLHPTLSADPKATPAEAPPVLPRKGARLIKYAAPLLAALVATAAGIWAAQRPTPVRVQYDSAKVDRGPIQAKVTANGALSALVTVNVGSQVSGRVQTLRVDFGSEVKKGQVVATLDPAMFQAAAAQAMANQRAAQASVERGMAQVASAERQYARSLALQGEGLATRAELEATEASLAVARADLNLARANATQAEAARAQSQLNLKYTTITSPIDGVVISRNVDVGQTVAATLQAPTLFTVAQDLTRMQVDTNVAEADIGKIKAGMEASFTIDAYPKAVFHGRLRQVRDNAQTVQNVVTYDAVVDVDNGERLLKPGMTANVTFVYAQRPEVLRIPNVALRFRPDPAVLNEMTEGRPLPTPAPDGRVVWRLEAGKSRPVVVRAGISDGTYTELVEGELRPGDALVIEARTDGSKRP